jgi:hypothetical protein
LIVCGDKVYKFSIEEDGKCEEWIEAINGELRKLKMEVTKKIENYLEIKLKKKVIIDYYNLQEIHNEKLVMKKRVEDAMKAENYFLEKKKAM